jgi:hypothetical protein
MSTGSAVQAALLSELITAQIHWDITSVSCLSIEIIFSLTTTCFSTSLVRPYTSIQGTTCTGSWFFVVLAATAFVYDFLLTFATEVEQIWMAPWTPLKVVYLLQRYSPFIDTVFLTIYCGYIPSESYLLLTNLTPTQTLQLVVQV